MPGTTALGKRTPQNIPTLLPASDGFGGSFLAPSTIGPMSIYKPQALTPWVKARGGYLASRAEIIMIGDSTTAGIGSDNSSSGVETSTSILNSVPGQLRSLCAARTFIDPGEGVIMPTDTRWALAGGATLVTAGGNSSGPLERYINLPNASATATLSTVPGTDYEIHWYKGGTLVAPTATIDGTTITIGAGSTGSNKVTVSTVADGSHTIVITGGSAGSRLSMVVARRNPTKGIGVHRMGIGGMTTDAAAGGSLSGTNRAELFAVQFTNLNPALVCVQFAINDWIAQMALATFQANLQLIITQVVTTLGKCVLLVDSNMSGQTGVGSINRSDYSAVMRGLCDTNSNTAYVSNAALLGTYANVNSQGLMSNISHPNAGGYSAIALGVDAVLWHPRLGLA